jgi:hypothetical protein
LLPEDATALVRRRRWLRAFRWAAMIAVVVGGGRLLMGVIRPGNSLPRARDITTAVPAIPPAVASREETSQARPPVASPPTRAGRAPSQNRTLATKTAPQPKQAATEALVDTVDELADTTTDAFADSAPADDQALAAGVLADSLSTDSVARDTATRDTVSRDLAAANSPRQDDELATRRAAAEALAELDRERRRERAAAATAALRPAAPETVPPPAQPPPPPRTPEQRAQIYLRIGLDEAVKQLGGPVHVIEGMTPELIGLVNGRLMPGADPNRPVVRVVYLDSRGRMILLDQQRLRTGQAPPAAPRGLRWSVGDVMLYLRGEPGSDVLRTLQRRVR